jgi:hypothetical protein
VGHVVTVQGQGVRLGLYGLVIDTKGLASAVIHLTPPFGEEIGFK